MMNHFLTDKVFNGGITDYLNAKKYGSAEQKDLWSALNNAASKKGTPEVDVAVVMDSWTLQTGFPLVNVIRDYGREVLHISQVIIELIRMIVTFVTKIV